VLLVGIAALGVILPGLPTTIFLIGASWCFARSCPWLEERLIRVRFFRPFLVYIDRPTEMPRRAIVTTVVVMWLAIALSVTLVTLGDDPRPRLAGFIVGLGVVGSLVLATIDRRRQRMTDRRTFDPGSAAGS
jgi:hypothetical protein